MPNLELEKRHVLQLLALIAQSAIDVTLQNPPEPDFSIHLNNEIIGIEHTQLIRKEDSSGVNIMAHTNFANQIMRKANGIFRQKREDCLMAQVDFKFPKMNIRLPHIITVCFLLFLLLWEHIFTNSMEGYQDYKGILAPLEII
ncbi:hypothetical protein [Chitinophaga silvisoli]|uniref:Uncharacterized protein n=1 Tax=Chitinophaga silvisoli TaxID=2291814 RepID=A0A3E1NSQ2_9BACT|nr:hypothetical protein [Chitinophaga silvisoli]RFM30947.1 hypothetical protein DXN04_31970 [Chitinophaga silvisoli]